MSFPLSSDINVKNCHKISQRVIFICPLGSLCRKIKYVYKQGLWVSCESNKRTLINNPERRLILFLYRKNNNNKNKNLFSDRGREGLGRGSVSPLSKKVKSSVSPYLILRI